MLTVASKWVKKIDFFGKPANLLYEQQEVY
jgi:hypothetical protein